MSRLSSNALPSQAFRSLLQVLVGDDGDGDIWHSRRPHPGHGVGGDLPFLGQPLEHLLEAAVPDGGRGRLPPGQLVLDERLDVVAVGPLDGRYPETVADEGDETDGHCRCRSGWSGGCGWRPGRLRSQLGSNASKVPNSVASASLAGMMVLSGGGWTHLQRPN